MKMINPTDTDLEYAFCEHVSHWVPTEQQIEAWQLWAAVSGCDTSRDNAISTAKTCDRPNYCTSADAVLPWLEKWQAPKDSPSKGWCTIWSPGNKLGDWMVYRSFNKPTYAATLPRAIVIALLRENGVEIEFAP